MHTSNAVRYMYEKYLTQEKETKGGMRGFLCCYEVTEYVAQTYECAILSITSTTPLHVKLRERTIPYY